MESRHYTVIPVVKFGMVGCGVGGRDMVLTIGSKVDRSMIDLCIWIEKMMLLSGLSLSFSSFSMVN